MTGGVGEAVGGIGHGGPRDSGCPHQEKQEGNQRGGQEFSCKHQRAGRGNVLLSKLVLI